MDREVVSKAGRGAPARVAPAAPATRVPPAVAGALALQRGGGNRAAARVLSRQAVAAPTGATTPALDAEQARGLDLDLVLDEELTTDPYADVDFEPPRVPEAEPEPDPYADVDFEPPRVPEAEPEPDHYADVDFEPPRVPEPDPYADADREPPPAKPKPKRRKPKRQRSRHRHGYAHAAKAGNTAAHQGPRPAGQPPIAQPAAPKTSPKAKPGPDEMDAALERLHRAMNAGPSGRERALSELLSWSANAPELRRRYQQRYQLDLLHHANRFGPAGAARARDLLNFGRLRAATKVLLALDGWMADKTTLYRVLADLHNEGQWDASFAAAVKENPELGSRFGGMTVDQALAVQMSGPELLKARAMLKQGAMKPVDKIYNALKHLPYLIGADRVLLFEGLAAANPSTIRAEFAAYPGNELDKNLLTELESKLKFHLRLDDEYLRALALIGYELNRDGKAVPRTTGGRALALVRVAIRGIGTDTALLWPAVEEGVRDPAQRKELQAWVKTPEAVDELGPAALARFKQMVGVAEGKDADGLETWNRWGKLDPKILTDPVVAKLRRLGGVNNDLVDGDPIFKQLKLAPVADWQEFRKAYATKASPFRTYIDYHLSSSQEAKLPVILGTDLRRRLELCFGGTFGNDDEEYLFHLLSAHATDAERRALRADTTFTGKLKALTATERAKVDELLRPRAETADEAARYHRETMPAQRHRLLDTLTGTGTALEDENRELQGKVRHADPALDEQRRQLAARRLNIARADYERARDELNAAIELTVGTVAGLIGTFLTAGVWAAAGIATNLARLSTAMATQKLVTAELMRGEQFDALGTEGLQLATVGAVDGMMNVLGGHVARGVTSRAVATGHVLFLNKLRAEAAHPVRAFLSENMLLVVNSTLSGVASGTVVGATDALAREATWYGAWVGAAEKAKTAAHEKALASGLNGATLKVGARLGGKATASKE